jgi:hypothetical protein
VQEARASRLAQLLAAGLVAVLALLGLSFASRRMKRRAQQV